MKLTVRPLERFAPEQRPCYRMAPMNPSKEEAERTQAGSRIDIHSEAFLRTLMRRQLRLSMACAATFVVALLGLPLANYFLPELMAKRIFGFTLTWLILGVLFFPY